MPRDHWRAKVLCPRTDHDGDCRGLVRVAGHDLPQEKLCNFSRCSICDASDWTPEEMALMERVARHDPQTDERANGAPEDWQPESITDWLRREGPSRDETRGT